MGLIYTCDYIGNIHFPNIKFMLIKTSSFFTIFHFVIVSVFEEWLYNVLYWALPNVCTLTMLFIKFYFLNLSREFSLNIMGHPILVFDVNE